MSISPAAFFTALKAASQSHNGSVGALSGICIQKPYSLYQFNFSSDFADQLHIVSLAEIGNTFDDLIHARSYLC
jgi:hypothetical protein